MWGCPDVHAVTVENGIRVDLGQGILELAVIKGGMNDPFVGADRLRVAQVILAGEVKGGDQIGDDDLVVASDGVQIPQAAVIVGNVTRIKVVQGVL
jgi:hypothetical protein